MYFFVPQHIIFFEETQIKIISFGNIARILEEIDSQVITTIPKKNIPQTHKISTNFSKSYYLNTVEKIKQHIIEGDVYELNFCMGFFIENIEINPLETYLKLKQVSPMPFSAFLKLKDRYVLCASPERFLKKEGIKIISQPIKGTIRRGKDENEDDILKKELRNSEKELAENMMIVDLVRNDLARTAKTGSIKATELFGIYTFPQVHQMISTIEAAMNVENNAQTEQGRREAIEFIKNAFPMGSMTGAPKIKAMELIENYEKSKRGVFSGTIGYINPVGDFDFNVVIRSIFYNSSKNYLGFQAGSAITYDSIAEQEYEECLLKTKAIREII
jgi:para-aminobenzoate synthetase component 1